MGKFQNYGRSRLESRCKEESNLGRRLDILSVKEIDGDQSDSQVSDQVYVKGLCMLYKCKTIHPRKKKILDREEEERSERAAEEGSLPLGRLDVQWVSHV